MNIDPDLLLTALVGMVGIVVGAAMTEWRTRRAEQRIGKRATNTAVAGWHRENLQVTRRALRRQLAHLEAVALGDLEAAHRHELAVEDLDMNIALVGDEGAIRAYHELVVDLRRRFGRGLPPDYSIRSARTMNAISKALDEQEERAIRGEPLLRVDPSVAPDLFAPERLAERLDLPWRLPSWSAVLGRQGLDLLGWLDRRIGRRK